MKASICALMILTASFSAMAEGLHCAGVDGYEISARPGSHKPFRLINVSKNGALIVTDLIDNAGFFLQMDGDASKWVTIVRAAKDTNRIVSSLAVSVRSTDGGYTGDGNAVIFDGQNTMVINGLKCEGFQE